MPELPEVQTIVSQLNNEVLNRTFVDVWSDHKKMVKGKGYLDLAKKIKGEKILQVARRAKNIIFLLTHKKAILIHQKMTGHLMIGKWKETNKKWVSQISGPLADDKMNQYIHFLFFLDDKRQIALSDLRKFAKVVMFENIQKIEDIKELETTGPEPLDPKFLLSDWQGLFAKKKRGKIKQVLMDPSFVAGIGNIYSDEMLWSCKVNPFQDISNLKPKEIECLYQEGKRILQQAVDLRGESFSDFRDLYGRMGEFDTEKQAYGRARQPCSRCKTIMIKKKIGARSTSYCPKCQAL